MRGTDVRK